jgi:hypothetical protein
MGVGGYHEKRLGERLMAPFALAGEDCIVMKTEAENTGVDEKGRCYSVIVREDLPTELRARRLWRELVHDMGQNVRCEAMCQPVEQIKESLDFDQARLTDIVIISVHDLPRFLFAAAGWLDDWLSIPSPLPRALFILHDGEEDDHVLGIVRKLAEFAGVTLICRGREPRDEPAVIGAKHDRQPAEDLVFVS